MGYAEYLSEFDSVASKYIPERNSWTPADRAVYGVPDLYRVPNDQADELRFKAIKYQFIRHYEQNRMYRRYCERSHIVPDDLRTTDDLSNIPLIPSDYFKDHPRGKDFALWLANLYTGDIPTVRIKGRNPSYDEVIEAFNSSGLAAMYSSGTGGRHTFVPRDMRSFHLNEYAMAKGVVNMFYPVW
ncbi:MAG: hypothetical protein WC375_11630, partial [Methanomassiliicoccales archaeon]